ncbi:MULTISPECIES: hypothetical protein [unclassified Streptomyces]|uniref:hypothetical protein n=1 Tax=unclassified Streptomyces TaxID=2593676 RepID=UPI00225AF43E|nr:MULTISPECIES: hypothetical protein [unclassified Streptomyces]MCX4405922.1 hypothetical protein [Streptomyces sp. NBC_01764]MCX5189554.1 hypothetical protein [Streptomyces sp. NBC_00268]
MISNSGRYWSSAITVTYSPFAERINDEPSGGWHAKLEYQDDGFADNDPDAGQVSTEGTLYTRYPVSDAKIRSGLSIALDTLLDDARRLGIEFVAVGGDTVPCLFYRGDGEDAEHPPPDGWRETLAAEAERIGFRSHATPAT